MSVDPQILNQAVHDVCTGMLGLELAPGGSAVCEDIDALSAVIRISGHRNSLVQVLAPMNTAKTIAASMFARDQADLLEDEIRDAIGEIVNMVSGRLKEIDNGESRLSLPCVETAGTSLSFRESFAGTAVSHLCQGDPLIVRIRDLSAMPVGIDAIDSSVF